MAEQSNKAAQAVHLLAAISRLGLKAFSAKNKQTLTFLILNDTLQIIRFNRASLWKMEEGKTELLGFSGEAAPNTQSSLAKELKSIVNQIEDPKHSLILSHEIVSSLIKTGSQPSNSVVWLPITSNGELKLGLLLERWDGPKWQYDEIEILSFLMQNYGAAWDKFNNKHFSLPSLKKRKILIAVAAAAFLALLIVQVPLRIVAPCEVVPENPVLITAPLEGIIEEVTVEPGQIVKAGTVLVEYDKKVPLEDVKLAEKQVYIIQAEIDRAIALSRDHKDSLADLAVLQLRLEKERNQLDLAKYKAKKLTITSPINGVVILDDPNEWRGNPVQIGEKIMMISDPNHSKIRIWIPESDNVDLNPENDIKIILNVNPDKTYTAKINYISAYITMSDNNIPSFIAEANWVGDPTDVKLGLKGTAILYGEDVTLLYWIARKPWTFVRRTLGL